MVPLSVANWRVFEKNVGAFVAWKGENISSGTVHQNTVDFGDKVCFADEDG